MGGIKVDSKFWCLARLQRAVADNCKTDGDLIRLECLQRATIEARVYRNVAEKEISRSKVQSTRYPDVRILWQRHRK